MIVLRAPEILNTDLEWLEPNGLGGYAASSLTGKNTRREHGLLVPARRPPDGRVVLLSRLDERLSEGAHHYDLASIQFPGHTTDGARHLVEARMDLFPVFLYKAGNIRLEKTIAAIHAEDTVVIRYSIAADELAGLPHLDLRPFAACRAADALQKNRPDSQDEFKLRVGKDWVCVESQAGMPLWIYAAQSSMQAEPTGISILNTTEMQKWPAVPGGSVHTGDSPVRRGHQRNLRDHFRPGSARTQRKRTL
jgi:predicted glycogen debranching enzyme